MSKKSFLKGTIILTAAGFLTRILGFIFRIFLSRNIGSEGIGLYQLVMPVTSVCYAIGISGLEVSVSRYTAYYTAKGKNNMAFKISAFCACLSMALCLICTVCTFFSADFIASVVFHNEQCVSIIKIMSLSIPFSCVHCMVSAYYIGREKTGIPAASQLFEQIIRILSVYIIVKIRLEQGKSLTAAVGAIGLVTGEIGSAVFCISAIILSKKIHRASKKDASNAGKSFFKHLPDIIKTSLPVSLNRVALHGMQSVEAALIPLMLQIYGLTSSQSLSLYGILTGMALPVILFPATLSNSVAQMLLPSVARIQNSKEKLQKSGRLALLFSVTFGFVCIIAYVTVGARLASMIFNEESLYEYIKIMAWLCPFIFIGSTYKSMLHALGKTSRVFINNMFSEVLNLICIVALIPRLGIYAYLMGLLLNQGLCALLHTRAFYKAIDKGKDAPL